MYSLRNILAGLRGAAARPAAGAGPPPPEALRRHDLFPPPERELELVFSQRAEHLVAVEQPVVLVSEVQRSGGSLLAQLFDGHPAFHVLPGELCIGRPRKWNYPRLDPTDDAAATFARIFDLGIARWLADGYSKVPRAVADKRPDRYPMLLLPNLQWRLFKHLYDDRRPSSQREMLDLYFTSFFNAWLDYQPLRRGGQKYLLGFVPRLNMFPESVAGFFDDYPDGHLISLVRDPYSWLSSVLRHRAGHKASHYGSLDDAVDLWCGSAKAMVVNRERYGRRVILLSYERLVRETEPVMRMLAGRLGVEFDVNLLTPTFQRQPIRANSVFDDMSGHGVGTAAVDRRHLLSAEQKALVEKRAADLHHRLLDRLDPIDQVAEPRR